MAVTRVEQREIVEELFSFHHIPLNVIVIGKW